jgi:hypothetical protein
VERNFIVLFQFDIVTAVNVCIGRFHPVIGHEGP